jgi:hypothetical protein
MFKRILAFAFFAALAVNLHAQNLTTVSASNIQDINGSKLAAGQLCFLGTDQSDNPISFGIGGGGQALRRGYCSPVTAGVVTSFTVPNPASTLPSGIYYRVTVKDSSTGQEVLRYAGVTFAGATFNFDNYQPVIQGASLAPLTGNSVSGNLAVTGNVAATGTVTGSNIPANIIQQIFSSGVGQTQRTAFNVMAGLTCSDNAGTSRTDCRLGTLTTVSFSATPTFDASTAASFKLTLTGNVTSSTLSNAVAGEPVSFEICQDATGGRTFVPPANVLNMGTIVSAANACSTQEFWFDGSNAVSSGPMQSAGSEFIVNNLTVGAMGSFKNLDGIRFADSFSGTGTTQINSAENDCGTTNCLVIVPATVAAGNGQSLLTKDNVFVWDMRTGSPTAQGTQLRTNVRDIDNGNVRSKMLLIDPVQPSSAMSSGSSSVSFEALSFIEGSMASRGTLEAINGTEVVDTGTTNSSATIIGGEFDAIVQGTAANNVTDVRGALAGCSLTGAGSITTCTGVYAQKPTNTGTGTIANAYSFHAEKPTVGTANNLSGLFDGDVQISGALAFTVTPTNNSFVNVGTNTSGTSSVGVFVRPGALGNGSFLAGGTQTGAQLAPITFSDATVAGIGLRARADTTAAAYVQALNVGLQVDTPGSARALQ